MIRLITSRQLAELEARLRGARAEAEVMTRRNADLVAAGAGDAQEIENLTASRNAWRDACQASKRRVAGLERQLAAAAEREAEQSVTPLVVTSLAELGGTGWTWQVLHDAGFGVVTEVPRPNATTVTVHTSRLYPAERARVIEALRAAGAVLTVDADENAVVKGVISR